MERRLERGLEGRPAFGKTHLVIFIIEGKKERKKERKGKDEDHITHFRDLVPRNTF